MQAAREGVKLLIFPECSLTGYPPRDIESPAAVRFDELAVAYEQMQGLAKNNAMYVIVGSVIREAGLSVKE